MMDIQTYKSVLKGIPDKPFLVDIETVKNCKTYREACRAAWGLRYVRNMTFLTMCEIGGLTRQHVSDWFMNDDSKTRKSMPAHAIPIFEEIVGNHLITQWIAFQAGYVLSKEWGGL